MHNDKSPLRPRRFFVYWHRCAPLGCFKHRGALPKPSESSPSSPGQRATFMREFQAQSRRQTLNDNSSSSSPNALNMNSSQTLAVASTSKTHLTGTLASRAGQRDCTYPERPSLPLRVRPSHVHLSAQWDKDRGSLNG